MAAWQGYGNFVALDDLRHPARGPLYKYKHWGGGGYVALAEGEWTNHQQVEALRIGPHQLAMNKFCFLLGEISSMVKKGQWVVLPNPLARWLLGLRLSPTTVKVKRV